MQKPITLLDYRLLNITAFFYNFSYDIVNTEKKLSLFALRQKIELGLCKNLENFVITKTLKIPTAFCQATKSSVAFILTAILGWVILFRELYQLTLLVTLKNSRVSFANRVSKTKKKQDKNAGANQKGYAATAANCCTRIFVSVISPWFV